MEKTIQSTVDQNLCISCGACVAVCPKSCIFFERDRGVYLPKLWNDTCIGCEMCSKVCPVHELAADISGTIEEHMLGSYLDIYCASSRSASLRRKATSGGVVTQLVKLLLESGDYDAAYLLDGYQYDTLLRTRRYEKTSDLKSSFKSRYLTVSHETAICDMLAHPKEKLILVATGCCVQAITNVIRVKKLHRENYLIIGLFCDKTMHYGVVDYFAEHPAGNGSQLKELYFRTKEAGGWPGNVRITYDNGFSSDLQNTERMQVKEYFMPERCLYCLDKLNLLSDIAVGDNYIPEHANSDGFSSVIIRTTLGKQVWEQYSEAFQFEPNRAEQIKKSQQLHLKQGNLQNQIFKGLRQGTTNASLRKAYEESLRKIAIGRIVPSYQLIQKSLKRNRITQKLKKGIKKLISR